MTSNSIRRAGTLLLALLVTGCAMTGRNQQPLEVSGQLAYRERIALAPGAAARIVVADVSVADRAAPVLAEQNLSLAGRQVPIPFALVLDPEQLQSHGRYSVRATISDPDGRLLWTTDSVYLIDPGLRSQDLGTLRLVRPASPAAGAPTVAGVEWVVEDVDGGGIIDFSRVTMNFQSDGRLAGRGGCNQYSGGYELDGDTLSVGLLAVTNRACAPALMAQEDRFLSILQAANRLTAGDHGALLVAGPKGRLRAMPAEPGGE